MRSFASSSCSNPSSSSSSLNNRLDTIFKKAHELCTLCEIKVCVIYYGPDGELKTWPEDREKVRDIALRYSQLNEAQRHKKSVDLYGFLNKKNDNEMTNLKKKAKKTSLKNLNELKYPIFDHYSPDQISQMIQSLELNISTLQERLRLVEFQRQKDTELDHRSLNPTLLNHQDQTQSLNPSQFSLFMYNHGNATLSQITLSASNFNQGFSELLQESGLTNHMMNQELCGYDQNMCMSDINNNFQLASVSDIQDYQAFPVVQESGLENQVIQKELYGCDANMCLGNINNNDFQHPCVSNTELYSVTQESINNYDLSQLIQHELCGYDKNFCMNDITNNNSQHPCVSNTEHYSSTRQESVDNYKLNQFIQHELCGYDQNKCISDIANNTFRHPCVSNTEHYSAEQESVDIYQLNQFIQHELCGYDQNMFTSDITNRNNPDPNIPNIVSDELCSEFQDHYDNMLMFS